MKISILQAQSVTGDYDRNLETLANYAMQASHSGADLLITPEMFLSGYVLNDQIDQMAKTLPLEKVQDIAKQYRIALIVGAPRGTDKGVFNSTYFIDDTGVVLNIYDKTHLFGNVDRMQFIAGEKPVVMTTYRGVNIAMLICYDVEFPETVRAAALKGAHLVAVATAQMKPFSFVNTKLIPTRAWENQVYIAYINQIGREEPFHYVGLSTVISPHYDVLVQASEDKEELFTVDIDPNIVIEAQKQNTYLNDMRHDLYQK